MKNQKWKKLIHLGIIVEDVYKTAKLYEEYGVGPWKFEVVNEIFANKWINGKTGGIDMVTATCDSLGFELELFSPTENDQVFLDFLKVHGPMMHHIGFESSETYAEAYAHAEKISGRKPYLEMKHEDGTPMLSYLDLQKEMGILLEVHNQENGE